jgi:hypothetical protein
MYYAVKSVSVLENYKLFLVFETGEKKVFDMKPYLKKGVFTQLENKDEFSKIKISYDTVAWENGADFDPEVLYKNALPV